MPNNAVDQARKAGYTDTEIADHLAARSEKGFDLQGARSAGYSDSQIIALLSGNDPTTGQPRVGDQSSIASNPAEELTQRRVARAQELSETDKLEAAAGAGDYNPTNGMTISELALAGAGKSFKDTGRGVKQLFGADNQAEIDESRQTDAPLMRTPSGTLGNIGGAVAQTVPAAFVPGANTLVGAGLTGGAFGAAQPVGEGESRGKNTAIGAVAGVAGPVLARATGAAVRGTKALVEPFTAAGRERIAGRTLERFGVQPADVAGVTGAPTATGARTTLAEQITRPEGAAAAARLQDSVRAANPEVAAAMAAREGENNASRVALLEGHAAGRDAAAEARSAAAGPLYKSGNAQVFNPSNEFAQLSQLPAVRKALSQASENMANQGSQAGNTIETLHQAKLAMDDQVSALMAGRPNASTVNEAMSIKAAQSRLVKFIESQSPDYAKARATYAKMSEPVNQADIAAEVVNRGAPNVTDLAGNRTLQAGKITNALADERKLMKGATGRDLGDDLSKVMTTKQLDDIRAVVGEVDRAGAVARAGNGPGSATAQRLSGTNILEQMTKGTGLPDSTAGSAFFQEVLARPLSFLYKGTAEPAIQKTLGEIILNPALANKAMAAASASERTQLARVLANPQLKAAARALLPSSAQANRR